MLYICLNDIFSRIWPNEKPEIGTDPLYIMQALKHVTTSIYIGPFSVLIKRIPLAMLNSEYKFVNLAW
jgi:hypothetical protein